jgi:hypothetical protein
MKHPKNSAVEMKKNPGETINKTNPLADKGMTKKRDSNLSADPQGDGDPPCGVQGFSG